jgi:hypothetical protein
LRTGNSTISLASHSFVFNDHDLAAATAFRVEFELIVDAFRASLHTNHHDTFSIDGLDAYGIDGLELQIDGVSSNPATAARRSLPKRHSGAC